MSAHEKTIPEHGHDANAEGEHAEHAGHEEHAGGHKHHKGHGGHGDGHGGGHGGNWIVTYCDMITLLIAFFICILTFASAESGKHQHRKMRDSVLYGTGGTGIAGPDVKTGDQDAVVWRQVLISSNPKNLGSTAPPLYSNPTLEVTGKALAMLEQPAQNVLGDSYGVTLPFAILFSGDNKLSSSGRQLLDSMANNVAALPYDMLIEVDNQALLKRATAITLHLENREVIAPARLGVGVAAPNSVPNDSVRFVFVKRPKEVAR